MSKRMMYTDVARERRASADEVEPMIYAESLLF